MKSAQVAIGDQVKASQYNDIRDDAFGGSTLLAHQQTTPNMTLKVEKGVVYVNGIRVAYAGGNSPSFTAPNTHPRIDVVTIDSAGTIAITQGVEAASPSVPSYPASKIALCEVYLRVGTTALYDTDQTTNGYIQRDVRPFLYLPPSAFGLDNGSITYDSANRVATVVDSNTSVTYTFSYNTVTGFLSSITDGTNTWTVTTNGTGQVTALTKT